MTLVLWTSVALAQPDETQRRMTAEALFEEGRALLARGAFEQACPKFEEVNRLLPGKIGATLQLADCYERMGKLGSAKATYEEAARRAHAAGDARERQATERAAALAPRVPRWTIEVAAQPDVVVRCDGEEVGAPQWGVALPVDPGRHTVTANAPGKAPWSQTVDVLAGAPSITVTVPLLRPATSAEPPTPPAPLAAAAPSRPVSSPEGLRAERPPPEPSTPAWVWVVGGAGVALLGGAAYFGLDGLDAQSTLEERCTATLDHCPPRAEYDPTDDNARKNRGLSLFLAFGGLGAAGVGVAVHELAGSSEDSPQPRLRAALAPLPDGVLFEVRGTLQ